MRRYLAIRVKTDLLRALGQDIERRLGLVRHLARVLQQAGAELGHHQLARGPLQQALAQPIQTEGQAIQAAVNALPAAQRSNPPAAVVVSSYQDPRSAQWLAQQLGGVAVLQVPSTVADEPPADTLPGLIDHLIDRLLAARR